MLANYDPSRVTVSFATVTATENDEVYKTPLRNFKETIREKDKVTLNIIRPNPIIKTLDTQYSLPDNQCITCEIATKDYLHPTSNFNYILFDKSLKFVHDESRAYSFLEVENYLWHIKNITRDGGISYCLLCYKFSNNRQIDNEFNQGDDLQWLS
jgi:hypothetical protein